MAYTYCRSCEAGLEEPTFSEAITGEMECPICGTKNDIGKWERDEAIISLEQRIAAIEKHLGTQP